MCPRTTGVHKKLTLPLKVELSVDFEVYETGAVIDVSNYNWAQFEKSVRISFAYGVHCIHTGIHCLHPHLDVCTPYVFECKPSNY